MSDWFIMLPEVPEMNEFILTYYGHSCFTVECANWRVALDPYSPGSVPGLGTPGIEADAVLCSHSHGDHGYTKAVRIRSHSAADPFTVEKIVCPHDDAGGAKRGMNTIHVLHAFGEKIVHMGDVGCPLPEEAMEKLRGALVLLIPVGGFYTIDAEQADAMARGIDARVVVPMHYRTEKSGLEPIDRLEKFLALRGDVRRFGTELRVTPASERCTAVMQELMER